MLFRSGIGSVDSVKDAFNELNTTASTITTNMKSMNSSYNVVDNAINTIRKMPNVIEELNVSFGKLKEQPQDVADRIKSLGDKLKDSNQLESEQGRNQAWSESYKALNQEIAEVRDKVVTLNKLESSDNSLAQNQNKYYKNLEKSLRDQIALKKQMANANRDRKSVV